MRHPTVRRGALALAAALTLTGAERASAAELAGFTYTIGGLPAEQVFNVQYSSGVDTAIGAQATATQGGFRLAFALTNALLVGADASGPLNGNVLQNVMVEPGPVTGTAQVPAGATVTLSNGAGRTISLTGGPFTIPSGVSATAQPLPSTPLTVRCAGTAATCRASVPIGGGASARPLSVQLPAAGMVLAAAQPSPSARGAVHHLTRPRYSRDRRTHRLVLHAARRNAKGARVVLTYQRRP